MARRRSYEMGTGVEPVNDAFDRAMKSREEVLKKVRSSGGRLKLSDVQAIAERHGASFPYVLEILQSEGGSKIDVKNNSFQCRG